MIFSGQRLDSRFQFKLQGAFMSNRDLREISGEKRCESDRHYQKHSTKMRLVATVKHLKGVNVLKKAYSTSMDDNPS